MGGGNRVFGTNIQSTIVTRRFGRNTGTDEIVMDKLWLDLLILGLFVVLVAGVMAGIMVLKDIKRQTPIHSGTASV